MAEQSLVYSIKLKPRKESSKEREEKALMVEGIDDEDDDGDDDGDMKMEKEDANHKSQNHKLEIGIHVVKTQKAPQTTRYEARTSELSSVQLQDGVLDGSKDEADVLGVCGAGQVAFPTPSFSGLLSLTFSPTRHGCAVNSLCLELQMTTAGLRGHLEDEVLILQFSVTSQVLILQFSVTSQVLILQFSVTSQVLILQFSVTSQVPYPPVLCDVTGLILQFSVTSQVLILQFSVTSQVLILQFSVTSQVLILQFSVTSQENN
ncbi:hypothetical protein U0070_020842 [Myodes glareolus]|uniref:Uncharacterized protein n=1 Tax=Myodes glareolus TaxID=447135 RepID=A0AAW0IPG0_MYOGA